MEDSLGLKQGYMPFKHTVVGGMDDNNVTFFSDCPA
jgi:hypothetical protein